MSHTPGPWRAFPFYLDSATGLQGETIYDNGSGRVAEVYFSKYRNKSEHKANAKLIAAAPDLLESLKALIGEADLGQVDLDDEDMAKLDAARVAIAKAEGRVARAKGKDKP